MSVSVCLMPKCVSVCKHVPTLCGANCSMKQYLEVSRFPVLHLTLCTEEKLNLNFKLFPKCFYFILSPFFDFRANVKHYPARWRQRRPCTVRSGSVRSTKEQPHPVSLWHPTSQREPVIRAQGAGQWMMVQRLSTEIRSHLQSTTSALDYPWSRHTLYPRHTITPYTLSLSV